jgi:tetratricopeptide (TPR) repeat protein
MNKTVGQLARRLVGLAVRRPGLAVALWGEAGIGKTHLTLALLSETPINSVSVRSIQPWDGVFGVIPTPKRLSVWLERAAERLRQGEPLEVGELVQTLTGLLSANAPLILHVEDLHEAGPDRLEVWTQLALAVTRTRGVGLIATSRVPPPNGFEAFKLEPLDRSASDAALEVEAGGILPVEACAWIFEHARGNPLFTLEFFRFLSRHGFVWNDARRWRWRVPDRSVIPITVEATIERVIAEAGSNIDTRMALKARAYLESLEPSLKLEAGIWAHVASLEAGQLERAERNLWARGVLNESGFVHPLFREVSVKGLSIRERESFANRALEVVPLNIAGGFIVDAQLGAAKSLEWLTRVSEASKTPGRWLAAAVEFASGTERARLALEAARELTSSDLHQAQKFYRVALEGDPDPAVTLEFVTFLSPHRSDEAKALFEALPLGVRTSTEGLVARFQMMVVTGGVREIIDCWQNEFGSSSDLSPDALVHVIQSLKTVERCEEAIRLADRVLVRSDLSPWQRARVMNRKTNAYNQSNRYGEALELTNQILELLTDHGLPARDIIVSDRGMYQMHLGDYRSAQTDGEEALQLSQGIGRTPTEMTTRSLLAEIHAEFGDYALAEEYLLDAFEYQVHYSVDETLCDTVNGLIELYLAWRDRPSSGLLAQKYAQLSLEYAEVMRRADYLAASRTFAGS